MKMRKNGSHDEIKKLSLLDFVMASQALYILSLASISFFNWGETNVEKDSLKKFEKLVLLYVAIAA